MKRSMQLATLFAAAAFFAAAEVKVGGWRMILADERPQKDKSPDRKPDFTTTAEALAREFLKDDAAATKKYTGKTIEVTGLVMMANKSGMTTGFSLIGAKVNPKDDPLGVDCIVKEQLDRVWWLGQGQKVKVVGRFLQGARGLSVMLADCTVKELEASKIQKAAAEQLAADFAANEKAAVKKHVGDVEMREIIKLQGVEHSQKKEFDDYLANFSAE